ncbi:MAG: hypothetical protein RR012_01270 [Oscillospiraceae bacterium]
MTDREIVDAFYQGHNIKGLTELVYRQSRRRYSAERKITKFEARRIVETAIIQDIKEEFAT